MNLFVHEIFCSFVIMAYYLPNEIVDMIRILSEAENNYSAAERLYAERYSVIRVKRP